MAQKNNRIDNNIFNRRSTKFILAIAAVVLAGITITWLKAVMTPDDTGTTYATFTAKRGPLTISILEAGAIKAKDQEVIRCEVEGRTSITFLIPEGFRVKKGDLMVELDASTLEDNKIDQEILGQNAEAAYINAKETLNITKNQAESDIEKAQLTLKFAQQDLKQFQEGNYPNEEEAAKGEIALSQEELTRAKERLAWSQRLFDEKYISQTELQADQLAVTQTQNALTVAQNNMRLLQEFTYQRNVDQYTSDVRQAEMALERTTAKSRANVIQAEADLNAKKQEYDRQVAKLDKIKDQLQKTKLYATVDGMVIYATSARGGGFHNDRPPLAEGVEVFERQEMIYLPKSASSVAEVDVHEASLEKIRPGLPAIITVDALPGKKFVGTVVRIAPLPDPQSMWMNPDLKIYKTDIDLEGDDPGLRSGMSCKAEIIVEQYTDAVYIPVQAVLRVGGQPTIYVVKNGTPEERKVEISLDNNRMIKVSKGLTEGEVVMLTPPLKAATVEPRENIAAGGESVPSDVMMNKIDEKLKAANGTKGESGEAQETIGRPQPEGLNRSTAAITAKTGQERSDQNDSQMPSAEQMQRLQNMTPEERQQEMEKMKKQSDEQDDVQGQNHNTEQKG